MISIIISSRCDTYLQKTVDDLLEKAEGEIEIIVVLDGIWTLLKDDPRVIIIHQGEVHDNLGMRSAINAGVGIARGEYIMKVDEHVMMDKGYDVKLVADCQDDWLVVPRRHRLDAEKWEIIEDGRPPVDYMIIDYPYQRPHDKTCGMHGAEYKQPDKDNVLIDDLMTMQGSCWFIKKSYFEQLFPEGLDEEHYGTFTQEAQELSNTVWLSGGRVVVNKKTWYAHLHKGNKGKGYGFSTEQYKRHSEGMEKGRLYCMEYWLNTKDYKYDFAWLVDKFKPPGWKDTWKEDILKDRLTDYSTLKYKDDFWLQGLRT